MAMPLSTIVQSRVAASVAAPGVGSSASAINKARNNLATLPPVSG